MQKIQKLYENHYKKEFNKFKNNLLKTNQTFLEMYISKVMPDDVISEAVIYSSIQSTGKDEK